MTRSFQGTVIANQLTNDLFFSSPVVVPSNFFGIHNNSFGSNNVLSVTTPATATVALDVNNQPVTTMGNQGAGYYNAGGVWTCALYSGGGATKQATCYPVITPAGHITNCVNTSLGVGYTSAPTVSFPLIGGPDKPSIPFNAGMIRTHDYRGSGSSKNTKWYGIDPGDGSGNYSWTTLDECVLWHAAKGRDVMFTLYGTPAGYVATAFTSSGTPLYINSTYDNQLGGSSPLNAAGLTVGTAGLGLDGFIKALVTRYNVNANLLTNPLTGQPFASGTRLIKWIEVWNEPQFSTAGAAIAPQNGQYWLGTAQNLVDMTRIINKAAKGLDPLINICACGFVASFPMSSGTSQFNHFNNFMTAVDTTEGKAGWQWIDAVSIHPYDMVERTSRFLLPGITYDRELTLRTTKATIASLGTTLPIICSEWGYLNTKSVFVNQTDLASLAIQLVRSWAVDAANGVIASIAYTFDSQFTGYMMQNPAAVALATQFSNNVPGKTITGRKNGLAGAIQLIFSDGSTYFTG